MNCKKWLSLVVAGVFFMGLLTGCGETSEEPEEEAPVVEITPVTGVNSADQFSDRDKDPSYTGGAGVITLKDDATAATGGVSVSGNVVTIQKAGVYRVSGSLSDGRVIVDAPADAKVQLVLEGASVTCSGFGALYVRQADKVFLTLKEGSSNRLTSIAATAEGIEENVDAALYAKDDVTINGAGKLTVTSPRHGVAVKADFVVTGGTLSVTAEEHAIQAKKSVRVAAGTFDLTAGKDGIHVENSDNASEGYLYVEGGHYTVAAVGDGFSAAALVHIVGGSGTLTCGGGAANGRVHYEGFDHFGSHQDGQSTEESVSAKGIKAGTDLLMTGGTWTLDAADDGLHSNGGLTLENGTLTISTGDDGLHADGQTAVMGGTLTVSRCYEGVEGNSIEIAGGVITITASDDGLNAAGGNDQSGIQHGNGGPPDQFSKSSEGCYIRISGGKLVIDASGDGIDANSDLLILGGETYVSGPTNSGNGALDYGGVAKVTGGVLCAVGSGGMAENLTEAVNQGAMLVRGGSMTSGPVVLVDKNGKELFRWTPAKKYNSVLLTCPGVVKGESYTLTVAGTEQTVEMSDWVYGAGDFGGPGGPGGGPGGPGGPGGAMKPPR